MAMGDGLNKGVELVAAIATVYIGVYAMLFVGTLFLGVIANLVAANDIDVSGSYTGNASTDSGISGAIFDVETNFQDTVDSITDPIAVLASLVIVGVLVLMFPKFTGGSSGRGDVL